MRPAFLTGIRWNREVRRGRVPHRGAPRWANLLAIWTLVLGAAVSLAGAQMEGGAIAVLGLAAVVILTDFALMPRWLIGPGTFFCFHHVGAYAVSPLGQLWFNGYVSRRYPDGFVLAQWGAALGLATWAVVYPRVFHTTCAMMQKKLAPVSVPRQARAFRVYAMIVTALSIAIWTFQASIGLSKIDALSSQVSQVNAELALGFQFATYVSCFLLAYLAIHDNFKWLAVWGTVVPAFVAWHLLDGSRGTIIMAGCFSACGFYYGGMRLRKVLFGGSVLLFLLVPTFGVVRLYRDANIGVATSLAERIDGFQRALVTFTEVSAGSVAGSSAVFLDRLSPDAVDYVFAKTPEEVPYVGWSGMDRLAYMFFPQVMLPNRPDLIDGNEVAIAYGAGRSNTSGNSLSVVADGYRRWGWPGIVILYTLIAACSAVVTARAWVCRGRLEWLSSLLILLVCLNGENTLSTLVSTFYYVIWIFPKYFLFFLVLRIVSEVITGVHHGRQPRRRLSARPNPAFYPLAKA
jgi:hypothetical protein